MLICRSISSARTIWLQLGVNRALPPRLHQPRQLHGDGRAAGDDVAAGDQLQRGAAERQRIDAGMRMEALVFIGEQQFEIGRVDIGRGIDRQPPAAVGHRVGTQQFAVAVDDGGRDLRAPAQAAAVRAKTTQAATIAASDQADCCQRRQPACPPPTRRAGLTDGLLVLSLRSFRRTHLDRTGAGAAVARGIVHVLDIGLRQHVFAGRNRAHHIGHREHRLVVGGPIDRPR